MVSVPNDLKNWNQLMDWVDDPLLRADPSLAEGGKRQQQRDFILDRLSTWSKNHNKEELVVGAQARRVPASPVATVLDLANDPQLMARGFLQKINHPQFGEIMFPMGTTAHSYGITLTPAPALGQHTVAVLSELGYAPSEIQALVESSGMTTADSLGVGDQLILAEYGPLTIVDTVRWAGAQENPERVHFDREFVRENSRMRTFIASGGYRQALLARALTGRIGLHGRLLKLG